MKISFEETAKNIDVDFIDLVSHKINPNHPLTRLSAKELKVKQRWFQKLPTPDEVLAAVQRYVDQRYAGIPVKIAPPMLNREYYQLRRDGKVCVFRADEGRGGFRGFWWGSWKGVAVPGAYEVPLSFDIAGVMLEQMLYVRIGADGGIQEIWGNTENREQLVAKAEGKKLHYLLVKVQDRKSAEELSDKIFNDDCVKSVQVLDSESYRELMNHAALGALQEMDDETDNTTSKEPLFLSSKEKPEEKKRRLQEGKEYF